MSKTIIIRLFVFVLPLVLGPFSLAQPPSAAPSLAPEEISSDTAAPLLDAKKPAKTDEADKPAPAKRKNQPGKNAKKSGDSPKAAADKKGGGGDDDETKVTSTGTITVTVDEDPEEEPTPEEKARQERLKKLSEEVSLLTLERDKLVAENIIAKETVIKKLSDREAATEVIEMEIEEAELEMKRDALKMKVELERELADLRAEKERVALASDITKAKAETEVNRYKIIEEERKAALAELTSEIALKEKELERKNYTDDSAVYLENPLQGKALVISDRRVMLNGPIYSDTADFISERINYFNNKDKKLPIFIVIDYSPGGSVMSGYKILKAMEGSEAPVYVVVKSYAASMAACITTLADKSFAYPNALVLHHQLSGVSAGNLTQQREFVEEAEEWWRRLAGPVAKKMGVSLDDFIETMYKESSTGDWVEFADEAKKLKWVDHVIDEIRETSLVKHPDAIKGTGEETKPSTYHYGLTLEADANGKPYVNLPRLAPFDYYWLYNPDGFYRMK